MTWRLTDTNFVVVDTETTGVIPGVDKVVDIALVQLQHGQVRELYSSLVNPGVAIPPEASAIHHITDKHVKDAPPIEEIISDVAPFVDGAIIVAHNAAFDKSMFPIDRPWLCTYRLARHVWPELKRHSNQYLRYALELNLDDIAVHRASGDALVTAHILSRAIGVYLEQGGSDDVRDLWRYSQSPLPVSKMPFGKHKGLPLSEVPRDYLEWARRNIENMDIDLASSIDALLGTKRDDELPPAVANSLF